MSHAELNTRIESALKHLTTELDGIRTGRANPSLVEAIEVECYDSRSPLQQLAAISAPEPQLLVIQPWDPSITKDIERALQASKLGVSPVADGKTIRLPFPPMTEERRNELAKVAKEKAEEARISVRAAREDAMKDIKKQRQDGVLSEDVSALKEKEIQVAIEKANTAIDTHLEDKVAELSRF